MSTTLNDRNIKKVLSQLGKNAVDAKWWKEYRSNAVASAGVEKALAKLEKLDVPKDGRWKASKENFKNFDKILQAMDELGNALIKARNKCGKAQSHTKQLVEKYSDFARIAHAYITDEGQNHINMKVGNNYHHITGTIRTFMMFTDNAVADFEKQEKELAVFFKGANGAAAKKLLIQIANDVKKANAEYNKHSKKVFEAMKLYEKMKLPSFANAEAIKQQKLAGKAYEAAKRRVKDWSKRITAVEKTLKAAAKKLKEFS
ncbi:hypothetical protein [Actibacterium pelagium]|uniref:Uncharacterized protein n=1 Tax=Actibacterium pelagium TaxID=2029103 RepID=A0A917EMM5_9RHOB|nr:hypothetical protein [Actibacterium pelagium]GGE57508.1 hypothetical protein GCM10011517_26610 [Actibacterium pelagium]